MSTLSTLLSGVAGPGANGTFGLVAVRKKVYLADLAEAGVTLANGDVLNLLTLPAGFKPVAASIAVISPDTGTGTLTAAFGATSYGVQTARSLKADAGTVYDNTPTTPAMLSADTTVSVTIAITGTVNADAVFEVVIMGYWLGALPGDVE